MLRVSTDTDRSDRAVPTEEVDRAFRSMAKFLLRYAERRFHVPLADAENLLQDLFLGLVQAKTPIGDLRAWLVGGMANACRGYWRHQTDQTTELPDFDRWLDPTSAALVDERHYTLILQRLARDLAPRDAQILAWHYLDGRTAPEIAQQVGITPAYATLLIHRCLARARAIYRSLECPTAESISSSRSNATRSALPRGRTTRHRGARAPRV